MTDLQGLYRIADDNEIEVDCFAMESREAFSLMDLVDGACYIAIDPFKLTSEWDEQQKLAHELGHCMTGAFYNVHATCDIRAKKECKAWKWAVTNLISEDELDSAIADGYTEIWSLADYFGVTEEFIRKVVCLYTYGNLATELYF